MVMLLHAAAADDDDDSYNVTFYHRLVVHFY